MVFGSSPTGVLSLFSAKASSYRREVEERENRKSSLPIVHRALTIFNYFYFLEYPAGTSAGS